MEVVKNDGKQSSAGKKALDNGQGIPPRKLSYNELSRVASNMQQDIKRLSERNQFLENNVALARLNFLFEVVRQGDKLPEGLAERAAHEIAVALYPPRAENPGPGGDDEK
jgi:hypothetical protein